LPEGFIVSIMAGVLVFFVMLTAPLGTAVVLALNFSLSLMILWELMARKRKDAGETPPENQSGDQNKEP